MLRSHVSVTKITEIKSTKRDFVVTVPARITIMYIKERAGSVWIPLQQTLTPSSEYVRHILLHRFFSTNMLSNIRSNVEFVQWF